MTRDQKCEALKRTSEVDVRILVDPKHAEAFEDALLKLAESLPGFVANKGGYVDSPEWDEIEEIVDRVPEEMLKGL